MGFFVSSLAFIKACCCCLVTQLHSNLCNPMDCRPPGSSVHGISQARILERVAISFSRGSSQPREWTHVSCVSCTGRRILCPSATRETLIKDVFTLIQIRHLLLQIRDCSLGCFWELGRFWRGWMPFCWVILHSSYLIYLFLLSNSLFPRICSCPFALFLGIRIKLESYNVLFHFQDLQA